MLNVDSFFSSPQIATLLRGVSLLPKSRGGRFSTLGVLSQEASKRLVSGL